MGGLLLMASGPGTSPSWADDVQVNSYTTSHQRFSSVAVSPNGDFVVVWRSLGSSDTDTDQSVQGRRFTSSGDPLGDDFQVNTFTTDFQSYPSVALNDAGDFVVTWTSFVSDTGPILSIQGQRYDSSGLPAGDEFLVNTTTTNFRSNSSVAMNAAGEFVVVWMSVGSGGTDSSGFSIQGQRYESAGSPAGGEFQVNTFESGNQTFPSVAWAPAGGFVVVWESGSSNIKGQLYASDGSRAGNEFQVNTVPRNSLTRPSVGMSADGGFVVVWQDLSSSGTIQGRRFGSNGSPTGNEFRVNTYAQGDQNYPSVGVGTAGNFVVAWESNGPGGTDTSAWSIQGRRYSPNGQPTTEEFQLNDYTTGSQRRPSVGMGSDGTFVVVWESAGSGGSDTDGYSIQMSILEEVAEIFSDGFESGDTGVWSNTVGANTVPDVTINAPCDECSFPESMSIEFEGSAMDLEDGDLSAGLSWDSDLEGPIGFGTSFSTPLVVGTHLITASVSDSAGGLGSASITITVTEDNVPPEVTIVSPSDDSTFPEGTLITFEGEAFDEEDSDLTADLVWLQGSNNIIGFGGSFDFELLPGIHTVTASVTDSGSLEGSATITVTVLPNEPPMVSISAPVNGENFPEDIPIDFVGTASDAEDGDLTSALVWMLDTVAIGYGGIFSSPIPTGTHTIEARVTDSGGLEAFDEVTITVNARPVVTITSPADGSQFIEGTEIEFVGSASDAEDGDITSELVWTSSLDGPINTGGSFSTSLSVGTHMVTASVADSEGLQGDMAIVVTVTNVAPVVTIDLPIDGSSFPEGTSIAFEGSASDAGDGDVTSGLVWVSDIDGIIGFEDSFLYTLSPGLHEVKASVIDSLGVEGSSTITVKVVPEPPTVTIESPNTGDIFPGEASIGFVGVAMDAEDGDLTPTLNWTSSRDGEIGTGGSFFATLSVGTHTITATVADSRGYEGLATVTLTVLDCSSPDVQVNFDQLVPGALDADAFPEASFSSDPGSVIQVAAFNRAPSPPNIICTLAGTLDCVNSVFVDFTDPAYCLTFKGIGAKASGQIAEVRVFHESGETTVTVDGEMDGVNPIEIDLTRFRGVSRIEIVDVTDIAGVAWDDFEFTQ